jgi:hypothetical protein
MSLSFTIAAGPRQDSHSRVRVPWGSWPQFTFSNSRLPQPGVSGPRIYISPKQGEPGTGFPFRRLLRLARLRWRYSNPLHTAHCTVVKVKVTLRLTVSQSWCRAPSGTHDQIFSYYSLTVTVLFLWGALSVERMGLSFVYAAGSSQRSLSLVRVPWDSQPYFTVSDLRLPIPSPLTTRSVTVEVFDPTSARVTAL